MHTHDLIAEAHRLLAEPIDLTDLPDDADPSTVEEVSFARARQRLEAWLADRADRLQMLRYVHRAALARAEQYAAEAARWERLGERQARLAEHCTSLAFDLLRLERRESGGADLEPYKVELPNGVRVGIAVSAGAVQVIDAAAIPPALLRTPPPPAPVPDKVEIAKRLKAGEVVPGCTLVKSERLDWGRG